MWGGIYEELQAVLPAGTGVARAGAEDSGEVRQSSHVAQDHTCCSYRCHAFRGWSSWWWASSLVLLAFFFFVPSVAYASESWGTVDGPYVTGQTTNNEGYVVLNVTNKYDAALCAIGRGSDKIQLTNEQFAKLSNASTGGRFYEFASSFFALGNDGSTNMYVGWWGDSLFQANMVSLNGGYGHVWAVETNSSKLASALEDYLVIYNGGNLGGGSGGSGGHEGDYYVGETLSLTGMNEMSGDDSKSFALELSGIVDTLNQNAEEYNYVVLNGFDNQMSAVWGFKKNEAKLEFGEVNGRQVAKFINTSDHNIIIWNYALTGGSFVDGIFRGYAYYVNHAYVYTHQVNVNSSFNESACKYYWYSGEASTPSIPDTNWPESDPTPTPQPDVPEPSDVDIDVTFPTISVTVDNDFTPDLQGILDAMDEHCQHLQRAIYNGFAGYFESMKEFEEGMYTHYVTYFHDVTEWLDDWLKRWDDMFNDYFDTDKVYSRSSNNYLYQIMQTVKGISDKLDNMGRVITADDIPNGYDNTVNATSGSGTLKSAYNSLRTKFPK